ncbi:alpha/beta hydrolase family protein (plasmid) [Rhizobium gallicum]|uniref:Alpha/beta hydrolase family protein n=1 Tax=Rhizobium gallicum TaxID=56730 RepID=A0A1L5NS24_9HYPH|nr:alpha/beta hydrolase [Rhizobium gallicum]APO70687.1 alpha/beta hydrolase family protein [Rhizobium gallicum]
MSPINVADDGATRGYAGRAGRQVHFSVSGVGDPILLFAGAPRSLGLLRPLCQRLDPYLRAVAVDQPGFGRSDPLSEGSTMEDIADAMVDVLDALEITAAHVFGLHTGGKVAAALAMRHPHRIKSVIISGKTHSIIPEAEARNEAMRRVVEARYFSGGAGPLTGSQALSAWGALWRQVTGLWWKENVLRPKTNLDALLPAMAHKICDTLAAHDTVFASYRANFAFDLAGAVAAAKAPVHVIEIVTPAEDMAYGRQGTALAALAALGEAHVLPDVDPEGLALHADTDRLAEMILQVAGHACSDATMVIED